MNQALKNANKIIIYISFFVLFFGIGRILSLTLQEPMLGYGNSYDMIRIQACHQIWPANTNIDITQGTPAAPIEQYRLYESGLDVRCMMSSELIFTTLGIKLGQLFAVITGNQFISLKFVGLVKAVFLIGTAIYFTRYFYRRGYYFPLIVHSIIFSSILADPGVTLYLNTFYTEFSAIYFLYLFFLGAISFSLSDASLKYFFCIVFSLLGLAFSKTQHLPLEFLLSFLVLIYSLTKQKYWQACAFFWVGITPILFYWMGAWVTRDEVMELANKTNAVGALLGFVQDIPGALKTLGLPEHCLALAGAHWEGEETLRNHPCIEIKGLSLFGLVMLPLFYPTTIISILANTIPLLRDWTLMIYGNVEGRSFASVSEYQPHLWQFLTLMTDTIFLMVYFLPTLICILMWVGRNSVFGEGRIWFSAVVLVQWAVFWIAFLGDGLFDLSKHSHLCIPLLIAEYVYLICWVLCFFVGLSNRELNQSS